MRNFGERYLVDELTDRNGHVFSMGATVHVDSDDARIPDSPYATVLDLDDDGGARVQFENGFILLVDHRDLVLCL